MFPHHCNLAALFHQAGLLDTYRINPHKHSAWRVKPRLPQRIVAVLPDLKSPAVNLNRTRVLRTSPGIRDCPARRTGRGVVRSHSASNFIIALRGQDFKQPDLRRSIFQRLVSICVQRVEICSGDSRVFAHIMPLMASVHVANEAYAFSNPGC